MTHLCRRAGFPTWIPLLALALAALFGQNIFAQRPQAPPPPTGPWMNTSLSPDERADLVMKEMTLDEKVALLHGVGMPTDEPVTPENARLQPRRRLCRRRSAPGYSRHRHERRGLRRALQRRQWPLRDCSARQRGRRRQLGYRCGLRIRRAHRARTSRPGLQHVAWRRHQSHPRAAQRPHF